MTTRVNGDPLRLIQEDLEVFLHSLSRKRKWTAGKESCYSATICWESYRIPLSNLQLHNVTMHICTCQLCLTVPFVHLLPGVTVLSFHVCACAKTFSLLPLYLAQTSRSLILTEEPEGDNKSKWGFIKND